LLLLSFQSFDVFSVSVLQLFQLQTALRDANIAIYGGERSSKYLSLPKAPSSRHEYGTAALTLELVESMDDAIDHLHANGSGHTECIVTGKLWDLGQKGACKLNTMTVTAHKAAVVHQSVNEFCLVVCTMNTVDLQLSIDRFTSALAV